MNFSLYCLNFINSFKLFFFFRVKMTLENDTMIDVQGSSIQTSFFLSKYQRVEYIWRNGNNYIDTLRVPKQTTPFEVRIWLKISSSWVRYWVLSNYSTNAQIWEISFEINAWWVSNNSARFYVQNSSYWATQDIFSSWTVNTSSFSDVIFTNVWSWSSRISVNWTVTSWTISYTWTYQNYSAFLFIDRALRWSTFSYNSYISYCKIYDNWTLVRDFVPAYRKSDNVIWLVEKVSKTFFTNKGSWTFSKWSNVSR